MKTIKMTVMLLMLFFSTAAVCGCWNYRETNDLAIVSGLAVDRDDKSGQLVITVEVINTTADGKETKIASELFKAPGDTMFDCVRNLILKAGRKTYWSHAKVVVVSSEIARNGVIDVLDWIDRDAEVRSDMWIMISKEKTAAEILEGKVEINKITSFYLDTMMKSNKSLEKSVEVDIWEFINDLAHDGGTTVLPAVRLSSFEGKKSPELDGAAVFKRDKMLGYIYRDDAKNLNFIKNKIEGGVLVVREAAGTPANVTLEIVKNRTKVKPVLDEENLVMRIDVKPVVYIGELSSSVNLIEEKGQEKLKAYAEEKLKKDLEDTIKKVQREYGSDIFLFKNEVERKFPDYWREVEPNWPDVFKDLDVIVNVSLDIRGSGMKAMPIKVGE